MHHSHPNLYKLINILQRQQAFTEIMIIQYAAGGKHDPHKRRYVETDDKLDTLEYRIQDDFISVVECGCFIISTSFGVKIYKMVLLEIKLYA